MKRYKITLIGFCLVVLCGCATTTTTSLITPEYLCKNTELTQLIQSMTTNRAMEVVRSQLQWHYEFSQFPPKIDITLSEMTVAVPWRDKVPTTGPYPAPRGMRWVKEESGVYTDKVRWAAVTQIEYLKSDKMIFLWKPGEYTESNKLFVFRTDRVVKKEGQLANERGRVERAPGSQVSELIAALFVLCTNVAR